MGAIYLNAMSELPTVYVVSTVDLDIGESHAKYAFDNRDAAEACKVELEMSPNIVADISSHSVASDWS